MLRSRRRVALLSAGAAVMLGVGIATVTVASAAATRYEAESAPATCDGVVESNHAGFSGSGFCNGNNAVGAAAQFTVNASAAGTAVVVVRYANGTTANRSTDVLVNGAVAASGSAFEGTGAWTTWASKTLTVSVNAGSNTIRLNPTTANGLPNIDYLDVEVGGTPPTTPPPNPTTPPPNPTTPPPSTGCGSGSFNAEAVLSGSAWTARNGSSTVYTGSDMRAAVQAAVDSLSGGRTSKQRVVVRGSGSISRGSRISLPSYTTIDVCGTINVTGDGSGDMAPIYSRGTTQVEVQHLNVTGNPVYGIFMRNVTNVILGQIDMRLSGGLGVRIDNRGDTSQWTRNVRIDNVFVSGAGSHAVETYGVDGLTVGTVTARNVGESGLLLNQTINATVTTVDAENAGAGTGYAAFRTANRNGRVGSSYPTNIRVGTVRARGGGRGIFCVSESGGLAIDRVDIANTGNNSILIENCYGVNIATNGGTISGGGEVRLAERSEFPGNNNITLRNFTLTNNRIVENPCADNLTISNITLNNSTISRC